MVNLACNDKVLQIFGEQEKIYGYKDLDIKVCNCLLLQTCALRTSQLQFASGSLTQYLSVSSSRKLPSSTADDVEGTLYKFIPAGIIYAFAIYLL